MNQEGNASSLDESSAGVRLLLSQPWFVGYLIVVGLSTLLLLGLVVGRGESAVTQASLQRARELKVTGLLAHLRWQLSELENAEHQLMAAGDPRWADRCRQGMEAVQKDLVLLRRLVSDAGQRRRLNRLQPLVAAHLADFQEGLAGRARQDAAASALLGGPDELFLGEIHRRVSTLLKGQERLLARGDERLHARVRQSRWSLLVGLLWGVPPLALLIRWLRRQAQRWREELREFLQTNGRGAHGDVARCPALGGRPHMDR